VSFVRFYGDCFRDFLAFRQGGKATWNVYNLGGWLILSALLKNLVAKDVVSEVNDFIQDS
jgi:hypothetical protein